MKINQFKMTVMKISPANIALPKQSITATSKE